MFKRMPLILIGLITLSLYIEPYIPVQILSALYGLSLSIKSLIVFLLPAIVFMLLFKTIREFSSGATKLIFFILGAVLISNVFATFVSYGIGNLTTHLHLSLPPPTSQNELTASWSLTFPKWLRTDYALFIALFSGVLSARIAPAFTQKLSFYFDKVVQKTLQLMLCLIPIFITGFILKLIHENVFQSLLSNYIPIFLIIVITQYSYVFLLYLIANQFSLSRTLSAIKNMLPAGIAGFGSMSSAAALPFTILGTEKNTNHAPVAKLAIPTTVNIHLLGDCLAIPLLAFAVMQGFGFSFPSLSHFCIFALFFVLAKFSVAAIPGGSILVMIPVLESQFGFTPEMTSLITALYLLFDPFVTSASVLGNGAFAILLQSFSKNPTIVKKS